MSESKFKVLLKILKQSVKNPRSLGRVFLQSFKWKEWMNYIIKNYGLNMGLPVIDLLDLFPQFEETVNPYSFLEGASNITDLALLRALARKYKSKNNKYRYLEIGTWRGESVANLSPICDECVSIDLSEEELKQLGVSDEFFENLRFFSKNLENITHINQNSQTFDFSTIGKFDLIFIDGNHSYNTVKIDTQNAFKILNEPHSIIVWHDYLETSGRSIIEHIRWEVLAGILDGCPPQKRNNIYHISNTLCAIYIPFGDFKTKEITFFQLPNKNFKIELSAIKIGNQ